MLHLSNAPLMVLIRKPHMGKTNLSTIFFLTIISVGTMSVIEFGPPLPLYNVDWSHVVILLDFSTLFGGAGEGYRLKNGSSYMHIIVGKTQSKISGKYEQRPKWIEHPN